MKKVIVTGATGFIGRNFISKVTMRGVNVVAIVRDVTAAQVIFPSNARVHLVACSMENYAQLPKLLPSDCYEAFYHFAWEGTTGQKRSDYILQSHNAQYTCDALLVAKRLGCRRFITTGTITENVAVESLSRHYTAENLIYGLAKLYAHKLVDIMAYREEMPYVWAKLSNIYGGDNRNGNLISYAIKEIRSGRVPTFGPCQQPYNFTYIDDVLNALQLLGETATLPQTEYFISNGDCRKLQAYLESVAVQYDGRVAIGAREDDGVRYQERWFDNQVLLDIGFHPYYSFEAGLAAMKEAQR